MHKRSEDYAEEEEWKIIIAEIKPSGTVITHGATQVRSESVENKWV